MELGRGTKQREEKILANVQLYELGQLQEPADSSSNLKSGWRLRRTGRLPVVGYATGSGKVSFDVHPCDSS